jgi:hypothetical protein
LIVFVGEIAFDRLLHKSNFLLIVDSFAPVILAPGHGIQHAERYCSLIVHSALLSEQEMYASALHPLG